MCGGGGGGGGGPLICKNHELHKLLTGSSFSSLVGSKSGVS